MMVRAPVFAGGQKNYSASGLMQTSDSKQRFILYQILWSEKCFVHVCHTAMSDGVSSEKGTTNVLTIK